MKVGELIKMLKSFPENAEVFRAGMDGIDLLPIEEPQALTVVRLRGGGSAGGTHRHTPKSQGGETAVQLGSNY